MPRPGPNVTSDADTQPGSDSLFPTGFSGGGALVRPGSVGTGEIADGSIAAADLNLASVTAALNGTYALKANAINPSDVGYDVVILLGQSNMSGNNGAPDTTYLDPSDPRISRWVNPSTTVSALAPYKSMISLAFDPLGHADTLSGVGPGMPFAREWVRTIPSHRKVLLVPCATGSTPLATTTPPTWNSTVTGSLFTNAVTVANAAIAAAGANARVVAFLWIQGEQDATGSVTASSYQTAFDAMIAAFRAQVTTATATTPFVIGSMVPSWTAAPNGTSVTISSVHSATPGRVAYTGFASSSLGSGNIHYTPVEQRALGAAMLTAYKAAQTNTLTASVPAQVPWVITSPAAGQVALTWTAPASPGATLTDYLIEYKTVAASTWTTFAHGASTATTATVTGLTDGTSYSFRVSGVSAAGTGAASSTVTATAGFSPASIANLLSWFKADAITGVSDGASVSSWTDSAAGVAAVANPVAPTYRATGVNSKPAVRFTSTGTSGMVTTGTYSIGSSYTSFLVAAVTTATVGQTQFLTFYGTSGGTLQHSWVSGFTSGNVSWFDNTLRAINTWTNGVWTVWEVVNDNTGNTSDKLKNGTSAGASTKWTDNTNAAQYAAFGRAYTAGTYADVDIAEVLLYNAALDSSTRSTVRAYLGTKYGITVS